MPNFRKFVGVVKAGRLSHTYRQTDRGYLIGPFPSGVPKDERWINIWEEAYVYLFYLGATHLTERGVIFITGNEEPMLSSTHADVDTDGLGDLGEINMDDDLLPKDNGIFFSYSFAAALNSMQIFRQADIVNWLRKSV